MSGGARCLYLYAGLPEVDAESVSVPGVVLHQLLQGPEGGPPGDEEPSLVQLTDPANIFIYKESIFLKLKTGK